MQSKILNGILVLLTWSIGSIGIGGVFTIALINVMKCFGFNLEKRKGVACWIYITLFVYGLCILLELFA